MPAPTSLGELLASLRKRRGLTMAQVIALTKTPQSTCYWWEGPRSRPGPEDLQKLLDLYHATSEERLLAWDLRASAPIAPAA